MDHDCYRYHGGHDFPSFTSPLQNLRLAVTASMPRDQHRYWTQRASLWKKVDKHVIQAPLIHCRHNRELQLSRAHNVGTIPSRLHTVLLVSLVVSNLAYCCLLDYHNQSQAALIAELRGRSGHLAVVNMLALILFAARNNPLIPVLAISFDTFNLLHRWIGRIIILESIVHISAWFANNHDAIGYHGIRNVIITDPFVQCGLASTVALLIILVQSLSAIRHAFYEIFLHFHQALAVVALGATAAHIHIHNLPQKTIIYTILGIWVSERFLRIMRLFYCNISKNGVTKAHIQALDGGACRVTFHPPRSFNESPGYHIYVYIPSISLWMSHPFSVAMVRRRTEMEFSPANSPLPSLDEYFEDKSKRPSNINVHSVSCIMAARTGMTRKLFDKARSSPNGLYTCTALIEGPYGASRSLASYGTVLLFAGGAGITHQLSHIHHLLRGWASGTCATHRLILVWSVRSLEQLEWALPWLEEMNRMERYGRDLDIMPYVTRSRSVDQIMEPHKLRLHLGRPHIQSLVDSYFQGRIGAMTIGVCGPGALADDVRRAARQVMDKGSVDFWEEAFTW